MARRKSGICENREPTGCRGVDGWYNGRWFAQLTEKVTEVARTGAHEPFNNTEKRKEAVIDFGTNQKGFTKKPLRTSGTRTVVGVFRVRRKRSQQHR
jgi:hypothetical protein